MSFFRKLNSTRFITLLLLVAVFVVMLIGNVLTDKCADDFLYCYSFADGQPMDSFSALVQSMKTHAYTMNGRLLAHTFVQIFETAPKIIFNILNAAVFVGSVYLLYKLCAGTQNSNFLLLTLFSAVWVFEPGFGQVNFWLDGACNYLWAEIPAFLFLIPFVRMWEGKNNLLESKKIPLQVLFILGAFCMGAWLENLSGAAIFMAILFCLLTKFFDKRKVPVAAVLSIGFAIVGYACMIFAPAERANKSSDFSVLRLMYQFTKVMNRFWQMRGLIAAFVVLVFISGALKLDKKRILLSSVFAFGALGAGFIFTLSRYYPVRCMAAPALLFIAADAVLLSAIAKSKYRSLSLCAATLVCLSLLYWCPYGMQDIYLMHEQVQKNEQYIREQKAAGFTDITVTIPVPETKYCAFEQLEYLSETDITHYSNANMAKYYGVDSILGQRED